jgi:hypothetical protein
MCDRKAAHFILKDDQTDLTDAGRTGPETISEMRSDGQKIIKGGGVNTSTRSEDIMIIINCLLKNDYQLLHIIERLSSMTNFFHLQLGLGRVICNILEFCMKEDNNTAV